MLSPADAALLASDTHGEHCANAEAADREVAGAAMEKVAASYRRVAAAYRSEPAPGLLYWRGLLAQCLSQEEEAAEDLGAFVAGLDDSAVYRDQVKDARRRLRMLVAPGSGPFSPARWTAGLGVGLAGLGLAGAGAGLHGGTWAAADYDAESNTHAGDSAEYAGLQDGNRAGFVMLIAGGAATATGVILAAALSREQAAPLAVAALPTRGGGIAFVLSVTR